MNECRPVSAWSSRQVSGTAGLCQERLSPLPRSVALPTDLRNTLCDATLLCWIEQEISKLNWDHPQVRNYLQQHPEQDPARLLAVLAFAFVSQIFGSDEVARACRSDPVFSRLCSGHAPFAQELCSFRRKNRAVLVRILARVFTRALMRELGQTSGRLSISMERAIHELAVERLDLARHMDTADLAI